MCVIEDYKDMEGDKKPPIKLKNFFLFRPFEMYVKMYGLPTYGEIDPTAFVAITYAILFGMMFGDVGQGLLLVVGGFLFYRLKKLDLGAIISLSGVFSILFGFMYGSVFGNEEIMEQYGLGPLWVNPLKSEGTMTLLLTAVAIGVVLILAAMLLNICNLIKTKHYGKMLVDTNGIAGMVFYVTVLAMALSVLTGAFHVAAWIGGTLIAISLLAILFRERLTRMIENKDKFMPAGGIGMYITEAFFELFEILLSFVTNTISFIRIGGFALSHAGMMQVVYLLAEGANGYNPVVIILGNLLVMGIEGLIVGIQVLRLEFYEMFSRFYNGGGKPFMPYKLKNN